MAAFSRSTVLGPASRIRSSSSTPSRSRTTCGAPGSNRSLTTTSTGSSSSQPWTLAISMISSAVAFRSFSQ